MVKTHEVKRSTRQQQSDLSDDLPFGMKMERRRLAQVKAKENEVTLVAKIRDDIKRWEQLER